MRDQFVVRSKDQDKALFYAKQKIVYCTGLDIEEFLRLVEQAKELGERVQVAARSCDLAGADIELRRLHIDEIQAQVPQEIDRLFVYLPKKPLDLQTPFYDELKGRLDCESKGGKS